MFFGLSILELREFVQCKKIPRVLRDFAQINYFRNGQRQIFV